MIDTFVLLLTPILVLAIIALFGFVGCFNIPGYIGPPPTFDPLPGTFALPQSVSLDRVGDPINYTTDGTTPTTASTLYSGPISVSATTTIRAIASADGGSSGEADGVYTIAPITYEQLAENQERHNNSTVTTIPFSRNVMPGSLIVVWIWYNDIAQKVAGVSDTANNPYQRAVGPTPGQGTLADWQQEIWYAWGNIVGGPLAVTATFSGPFNAEKAISAHEYSGADATVDPLDTTGVLTGSSTDAATPAVTTNARLIFGAAIFGAAINNNLEASAGMDFTRRSTLQGNATEDKLTNPGLASGTFTNPDTTQDWIAQMVAFK